MKVDNYTATIDELSLNESLAWLLECLPVHEDLSLGKDGSVKRYRYEHAVPVLDGKQVVAVVRTGGNGGGTSIELKGSIAHETFGLLRSQWPVHRVSRLDVAEDGTKPGLFDQTFGLCKALIDSFPKNRKPSFRQEGDWIFLAPGTSRSGYFGSQEAGLVVVLYEKGKEREIVAGYHQQDPNWVRMELRVQPQTREAKALLSSIQPADAWGLSGWAPQFLEIFNGLRPDRVKLPTRISDVERTYRAAIEQYGKFFNEHPQLLETFAKDAHEVGRMRRGFNPSPGKAIEGFDPMEPRKVA